VREAMRAGVVEPGEIHQRLDQARERGVLSPEEAALLQRFDATVMALTAVDDFDAAELGRGAPA
jgi:hypothetical protein